MFMMNCPASVREKGHANKRVQQKAQKKERHHPGNSGGWEIQGLLHGFFVKRSGIVRTAR